MANTVRIQILLAVFALIDGAGKPAGTYVHRKRARFIGADSLPAIVVYLLKEPVQLEDHDGAVNRRLTIRCEARAAGDLLEAELEPLIAWIEQAVLADPRLGGLAIDMQVRNVAWDAFEADGDYQAAAVDVEVEYVTQRDNPEQLG